MTCGAYDPTSGKVGITLSWKPGGPDAIGQDFEIFDSQDNLIFEHLMESDVSVVDMSSLDPNTVYKVNIRTIFPDGEIKEISTTFTTVSEAITPPVEGKGNLMPMIAVAGVGAIGLLFAAYRTQIVEEE